MNWLDKYRTFPRQSDGGSGAGGAGGQGGTEGNGAGGNGASGAKPWFDGVDAETIGHWDNKGWKKEDPKALATELTKAWKGLEKHFGASADQLLKLPKDLSDAEGMKPVLQRLGVPAEAKDYDFTGVKFADGTDLDPAFVDKMRAALHAAGVPKDKAAGIIKASIAHDEAIESARASERAATLSAERAALEREWGPNLEFNKMQAMQGARRVFGDTPEAVEAAKQMVEAMQEAVGYRRTMEFWQRIGAGTNEHTFVDSGGKGGTPTTIAGAQARLNELMADPQWSANLTSKTAGAAEKREFQNLMTLIHGAAA